MKKRLNQILPKWLFDSLKEIQYQIEILKWKQKGCPLPAVHPIKQEIIKAYQKKTKAQVLIETGTYTGEMIYAQMKNFKEIHSIELSNYYYNRARIRFGKYPKVKLHLGNSAEVLHQILPQLKERAIFWLDGHYSGGLTAGGAEGETQCPILGELDAILPYKYSHVLLIDDARYFIGQNDYPTIEQLKEYLDKKCVKYSFEIATDVIRIELINE